MAARTAARSPSASRQHPANQPRSSARRPQLTAAAHTLELHPGRATVPRCGGPLAIAHQTRAACASSTKARGSAAGTAQTAQGGIIQSLAPAAVDAALTPKKKLRSQPLRRRRAVCPSTLLRAAARGRTGTATALDRAALTAGTRAALNREPLARRPAALPQAPLPAAL